LVLGFTYALPNLYPTQPSIQVAYTDAGKSADQMLLNELEGLLDENNIEPLEIFLRDNKIVIKFDSLDDQLDSKTILQNKLLDAIDIFYDLFDKGYSVMDIYDNYLLFIKSTSILNETQKYEIIKLLCKYITIFHNIHEDEIELALFTNNLNQLLSP